MVVDVNETATNLMYTIEDGTGAASVKKWIETDGDAAEPAPTSAVEKGSYVKVTGQLRSFRNERNVMAFEVRPLSSMNEMTHHFLYSIHTHLQKTGASAGTAAPVVAAAAGAYAAGGAQTSFGFDQSANADGFSKAQAAVLAFFKGSTNDEGTGGSVADCIALLSKQGVGEKSVRETIEGLTEEGHLYSTIDENHYQSTS